MENIGVYWTEQQTYDITNLLKEHQDMFFRHYKDLKGVVQKMGEMKNDIKSDTKPVKKHPYKFTHKHKDIVKKEIENMPKARIIYLVDQLDWDNHMVI